MADNPWIGVVLGIVTAGLVHTGKAVTRPVVNASTLGIGAPLVSTAEDAASVGLSVVAIFFPILVFILLIAMLWGGIVLWRKARRRTREREAAVTAYYG